MITSALLYILYAIIWALTSPLRLFADVSLPATINTALASGANYIYSTDFVFPVSTFLTIFGIYLAIEAGILVWKIANWLIHKIPTIS